MPNDIHFLMLYKVIIYFQTIEVMKQTVNKGKFETDEPDESD